MHTHTSTVLVTLAVTLLTLSSATSHAQTPAPEARQDIFELRRGELPVRHTILGWTPSNEVVVRALVCDEGGTTSCDATIRVVGEHGVERVQELMHVDELYCEGGEPCEALPLGIASRYIKAERDALATLAGTLAPGASASMPTTELALRATTRAYDADYEDETTRSNLVMKRGDAAQHLALVYGPVQRLEDHEIVSVSFSPDGTRAAVTVDVTYGLLCYDGLRALSTVVFDVQHHSARLANTEGFRAYKAGRLADAYRGFVEATLLDDGYALAWFNRGGLESLSGDLEAAADALARAVALDPAMATRACADEDFEALLGSKYATEAMACDAR